jgi:L-lactate dehydrogenase complex protein LldG
MKDDKAAVLKQIRESLKTAHLPAARATIPSRVPAGEGNHAAMVEHFRRELEPIGGTSFLARDDAHAIEILLSLLSEVDGKEYLAWDDLELPARGIGEALRENGYTRRKIDVPSDPSDRKIDLLQLAQVNVGITGAQGGLADTGSLALVSSPTRPRLASLLPPTHIALLPVSRLYPTMASFFAAHPNITGEGSNLIFVTGPSRTADIELTLQRGVHGPKFLNVILIQD